MSTIMKYEESFMTRIERSSMEDLMVLAHRSNLPCVRGIRADFVTEKILRKTLILKYRKGIFVTLLTRLSREVAAYMCEFLGELSEYIVQCDMAIVIGNTSWLILSTENEEAVQRWAVKKTIEPTNHMHPDMRDKPVERKFCVDASYDEFYELPNYGTVHDALLGIGYSAEKPLDYHIIVPYINSDWYDVEDDEEFMSLPPEHGPTFMVWLDQPNTLPEWHNMLLP